MSKRYTVTDPKNDSDILGGPVSDRNAYIAMYPSPVDRDGKHPLRLDIREHVVCKYNLCGSTTIARVTRIEDGDMTEA